MDVRALAFDVFGTLVDWRTGIAEAFRSRGVRGDPEELADGWRERYIPIMLEVNAGRRPWGNFDELHYATLDDLLEKKGLTVSLEDRRELVSAWHTLAPWPDVPSGLERLRGRFITTALSNGHIALLVDLARHGDLRFDCVISAELARKYKPAPELYLTAARLLCLEPAQVMMVASHPHDLEAARGAGMRTAFIDRPLEHGPGSPAREDPGADESVSGLDELAARLDAQA